MQADLPRVFYEVYEGLPRQGPGSAESTAKAFAMLQGTPRRRMLDIGCGAGGQTLTLARLSGGHVTALDNHQPFLDSLNAKAAEEGLGGQVSTVNRSMFDLPFAKGSFDLVWSEGAICIAGFERGLLDWRRLLAPDGYMAVSEAVWLKSSPPAELAEFWEREYPSMRTVKEDLAAIGRCGYACVGHFTLPESDWWQSYYHPLERRVAELRGRYAADKDALAVLDAVVREIPFYAKYSDWYGYEFYVMRAET